MVKMVREESGSPNFQFRRLRLWIPGRGVGQLWNCSWPIACRTATRSKILPLSPQQTGG